MHISSLPYCAADIVVNSSTFRTGLAVDPLTGTSLSGWPDTSDAQNHLLLRGGTPTYDTREGVEGLILDNTDLCTIENMLMMGAGTLVLAFSGGVLANNSRFLATIETFDTTTTRTGNPAWGVFRFVGSGQNRMTWGVPAAPINLNCAGPSVGDLTVQRMAFSIDMKPARHSIHGVRDGQSPVAGNPLPNSQINPGGEHIVFGRLNATQADASRTAVSGAERFWLSYVGLVGNRKNGNLIVDNTTGLNRVFSEMK